MDALVVGKTRILLSVATRRFSHRQKRDAGATTLCLAWGPAVAAGCVTYRTAVLLGASCQFVGMLPDTLTPPVARIGIVAISQSLTALTVPFNSHRRSGLWSS